MFKVGDSVMVRYHSREEKDNYPSVANGAQWNPDMNKMEGKIYKIYNVFSYGYHVHDGDRNWLFAHDSLVAPYDQF